MGSPWSSGLRISWVIGRSAFSIPFSTVIFSIFESKIFQFSALILSEKSLLCHTNSGNCDQISTGRIRNMRESNSSQRFCRDVYGKGPSIDMYNNRFKPKGWLIHIIEERWRRTSLFHTLSEGSGRPSGLSELQVGKMQRRPYLCSLYHKNLLL